MMQDGLGEWEVLVVCQLLNLTTREQVQRAWPEIQRRWRSPEALARAHNRTLERVLRPLGLSRRRAWTLRQMAREVCRRGLPGTRAEVLALPGCGPYAADAWEIFARGRTPSEIPGDRVLAARAGQLKED
jgi:endonuclease III